ncbi:MAG: LysM peptidoglycan-binding domain-containing protein, partial [Lactobacillales bacterium]|nr:LysM peptidoglycan-binding domain-containing protein [Lactobacillales bacterium]
MLILCFCIGCASYTKTVRVKKGDTLYSISKKHDVPMRDVINENGLRAPYTLRVGQTLTIPYGKVHTVKKGETLYSISKQYDMSVASLAKNNSISHPYTLQVGQKLKVSGGIGFASGSAVKSTSVKKTAANTKSTASTSTKSRATAQTK